MGKMSENLSEHMQLEWWHGMAKIHRNHQFFRSVSSWEFQGASPMPPLQEIPGIASWLLRNQW